MKSIRISLSSSSLHDEIVIEILNKVTLKSLHRLKWVSKSWYSLITSEVLPQLVKSPNLCIYYRYYNNRRPFLSLANPNENHMLEREISKSLDFLPNSCDNELPNITILDCCNGLIFCCNESTSPKNNSFFVCNPVDKTYHQISPLGPRLSCYALDFNPLISPHYKLVFVRWPSFSSALEFKVYHSKNNVLKRLLMFVLNIEKVVNVRPEHLLKILHGRNYIAVWNECVYLCCTFVVDPRQGLENKVIMISGVLEESDKNISYKLIKFPEGGCKYHELCSYMDTWRGKLRFVSISSQRIRVWALRDNHKDEWMLEHDCAAGFLGLREHLWLNKAHLCIVGFHPLRNVLLIIFKCLLYAYDFDQMSFEKFCEFENEILYDPSVISFSPCFAKELLA